MAKKFLIYTLSFLILSFPLFAKDSYETRMNDSLAKGYLAVSKYDIDGALNYFTLALKYANDAKNWKGLLDAGNAFSALGKPKESVNPFKNAYNIALSQRDWRGLVALAYSCASLPEKLRTKKISYSSLKTANKIASQTKDWRGVIEIAKAYNKLGKKEKAKEILDKIKKNIENLNLVSAYNMLSQAYRETGSNNEYAEWREAARKLSVQEAQYYAAPRPMPPGVVPPSPYGESVAGPPKISPEAQKAIRESADKDAAAKKAYIDKIKSKDAENNKYYMVYRTYYTFPYYYSYYSQWYALNQNQLSNWANFYLSRYKLEDETYVYRY